MIGSPRTLSAGAPPPPSLAATADAPGAGARAGAMSVLCGIAALQSSRTGKIVRLADLMPELFTDGAQAERKLAANAGWPAHFPS